MFRKKKPEPAAPVPETTAPPVAEKAMGGGAQHKAEATPVSPKEKKAKPENVPRLTVEVLGIREYVGGHFVMQDGGLMDVFQLLGRSLLTADEGDVQRQIQQNARYYRLQQKDIKIITLNYPTNTQTQCAHLQRRLERTADPVFRELLQDEIAALQYLEEYRTETVSFLFLFADSEQEYHEQRQSLLASSGFSVVTLDRDAKITLLRKLSNMNQSIKV